MAFLTELWLPIVLSAVFVFVVSSVIHMLLPYHKSNLTKMPKEDAVLEAMRSNGVGPGAYMFPCAESIKAWSTPEHQEKVKQGPVGWLTVVPASGMNMGKSLVLWFLYSLLIGFLVAYVAWNALEGRMDAGYLAVFQVAGVAAVLGYCVGYLHGSIWQGCSWKTTGKFMFDGLLYALVTAGTFGWLWPEGATAVLP